MSSSKSVPANPATLEGASSSLNESAHSLETELLESLLQHGARSVCTLESQLARALRALAPLGQGIDDEQARVERVAGQAEKDLEQTLRNVLQRLQGSKIDNLAAKANDVVLREVGRKEGNGEQTDVVQEKAKKKQVARRTSRNRKNGKA